jgi:hypothetical protein
MLQCSLLSWAAPAAHRRPREAAAPQHAQTAAPAGQKSRQAGRTAAVRGLVQRLAGLLSAAAAAAGTCSSSTSRSRASVILAIAVHADVQVSHFHNDTRHIRFEIAAATAHGRTSDQRDDGAR